MKKVRSSDTISGAVQAVIDAAKGLPDPPPHVTLRPQDLPYWESLVSLKVRDDWPEVQLIMAAQWATTQADITEWQKQLNTEGPVIDGLHGSRANPLVAIIDQATKRNLAIIRQLGLSATDKNAAGIRNASNVLRATRNAKARFDQTELLA